MSMMLLMSSWIGNNMLWCHCHEQRLCNGRAAEDIFEAHDAVRYLHVRSRRESHNNPEP